MKRQRGDGTFGPVDLRDLLPDEFLPADGRRAAAARALGAFVLH